MLEIINYNTEPKLQVVNATYPLAVVNINTVANLRAYEPIYSNQVIYLTGNPESRAESGEFRADTTDTNTPDDGVITIVTTSGKRWKRIMIAYDYEQFTASSEATSMASPLYLREWVEQKLNLNFTNPTLDGTVNMSPRIQSLLNSAGSNARAGRREVVIQGKGIGKYVGIGNLLQIPSDIRLIFDGDVTCLPLNQTQYALNCEATYPTTWSNLSVDAMANRATITLADASSFNVGDQIIIKSNKRIDTCPNFYNATVGQQCTIWRKESNVLHLDTCLKYDYLVSDTAQIGKIINPKKNITIEGFKWGEDGRTIRGGNAIELDYVDGFKIIGTEIRNMRNDDNLDNAAKNGIVMTGGRNGLISETIANRVGWYGITYQGCTENLIIEKYTSHWARHHISANWNNAPHQPMDITIRDSLGTFSVISGFDTHDVGSNILYQRVKSIGSQTDSGFQDRCGNITFETCIGNNNFLDGFVARLTTGTIMPKGRLTNCIANNNLRNGVAYADDGADLLNCETNNNIGAGRFVSSGKNIGGSSTGNAYSFRIPYRVDDTMPTIIENMDIRLNGTANNIYIEDHVNYDMERLALYSNIIYAGASGVAIIATPTGDKTSKMPLTDGQNKMFNPSTVNKQKGTVTLSGGTATVNTTDIRKYLGNSSTAVTRIDNVRLTILTPQNAGILGITNIIDKTSFTITSTNSSDASLVLWEITGM